VVAAPAVDPVARWDDGVVEDGSSCYGRFTRAASLTELPALSIPCGHDGDGLPACL
jgi:Asp-tRNA(Asn)/Glu-tRNA(Gln) amidotransferase A subunit family amidase